MGTAVWAALSNTYCECVVAKANEADCFANAEVEKPERERGSITNSLTTFNTHYIILFEVKTCTT